MTCFVIFRMIRKRNNFLNFYEKNDCMLIIRPENQSEVPAIYELIKTAFETADVKDGNEQDFAEELRRSENYIPELALVAELEGQLIGHIMLTKIFVDMPSGRFEGLLLAPLSVLIEHRKQGTGSILIKESVKKAKELGYKAVFLAGDRNYYSRFGFVPARRFGIYFPQEMPEELIDNIMALELFPGSLDGVTGTIALSGEHELDVEAIREKMNDKQE